MLNTRSFVPAVFAFCAITLATVRPANADTITVDAIADSYIMNNEDGAKWNFGSDPFFVGYNDGFQKNNILLQFKIKEIKAPSIRSAHLRLWSTGWVGDFVNTSPSSVFALSSPWEEMGVNWYYAADGMGWKNPGGDLLGNGLQPIVFATNTDGMSIPSGCSGKIEWDITELVRLWASGQIVNNGLRIDVSDGIFLFESRECKDKNLRPTIIIDVAD